MKSTGRLVALCAAIFFHGMALEAQGPSILEPRFERHQGAPYWISAEAVANEEKVVDLDLIDDLHLRTNVEKQRQSLGDRFPVEKSTVGGKPPIVTIPCRSADAQYFPRAIGEETILAPRWRTWKAIHNPLFEAKFA